MKTKLALSILALMVSFGYASLVKASTGASQLYDSPDAAVSALMTAIESSDVDGLRRIFGPGSDDLIESGDKVQDRRNRQMVLNLYREGHVIDAGSSSAILVIGEDRWPFPIPLVSVNGEWRFDSVAGREEIINRRIGGNELNAIDFCRDYVEMQKTYYSADRDGDGFQEYSRTFMSAPGKKNGLFWARKPGEAPSPMGPLAVQAFAEGYLRHRNGQPQPYHGYYFRILTAQGASAAGGTKSYIDDAGRMTGGFALVAYPVNWEVSGIMSFIVNQDGKVYQKNLGARTHAIASTMKNFNPDASWTLVQE